MEGYMQTLSGGKVKRYVQFLEISDNPELIAQYRKWHSEEYSWKEIRDGIRQVGILEMEIYILGNRLVMIVDAPADFQWQEAMDRLATLPRQAEWESNSENSNNGYQIRNGAGYHMSLPMDIMNDLRSKMCLNMKDWGIDVKYHHHEVGGCGQMEIEVQLGDMLTLADNTMAAKYVIKNEAARNGCTATLMPKPVSGEAGSGMHIHMLLRKDGQPIFYDENNYAQLSDTAMWFIGGLLTHAGSLCAITNPSSNSYKRLVPGYEAPVTIGYAMANRSAVIRIPAYAKSPDVKRFELRNPDATCNPYYACAAILMAGLDGIQKKIDPHKAGWGPYDFNLYNLSDEEKAKLTGLPTSLSAALDALEKDHDYLTAGGVFPQRLIDQHIATKRADYKFVHQMPNPAEFSLYYDL